MASFIAQHRQHSGTTAKKRIGVLSPSFNLLGRNLLINVESEILVVISCDLPGMPVAEGRVSVSHLIINHPKLINFAVLRGRKVFFKGYLNRKMVDRNSQSQMKTAINQKLVETGEKERLKDMLRRRLSECGWKDQIKEYAKSRINEKGIDHITVDELVTDITPRGRDLVPEVVKRELLAEIKRFLSQQSLQD